MSFTSDDVASAAAMFLGQFNLEKQFLPAVRDVMALTTTDMDRVPMLGQDRLAIALPRFNAQAGAVAMLSQVLRGATSSFVVPEMPSVKQLLSEAVKTRLILEPAIAGAVVAAGGSVLAADEEPVRPLRNNLMRRYSPREALSDVMALALVQLDTCGLKGMISPVISTLAPAYRGDDPSSLTPLECMRELVTSPIAIQWEELLLFTHKLPPSAGILGVLKTSTYDPTNVTTTRKYFPSLVKNGITDQVTAYQLYYSAMEAKKNLLIYSGTVTLTEDHLMRNSARYQPRVHASGRLMDNQFAPFSNGDYTVTLPAVTFPHTSSILGIANAARIRSGREWYIDIADDLWLNLASHTNMHYPAGTAAVDHMAQEITLPVPQVVTPKPDDDLSTVASVPSKISAGEQSASQSIKERLKVDQPVTGARPLARGEQHATAERILNEYFGEPANAPRWMASFYQASAPTTVGEKEQERFRAQFEVDGLLRAWDAAATLRGLPIGKRAAFMADANVLINMALIDCARTTEAATNLRVASEKFRHVETQMQMNPGLNREEIQGWWSGGYAARKKEIISERKALAKSIAPGTKAAKTPHRRIAIKSRIQELDARLLEMKNLNMPTTVTEEDIDAALYGGKSFESLTRFSAADVERREKLKAQEKKRRDELAAALGEDTLAAMLAVNPDMSDIIELAAEQGPEALLEGVAQGFFGDEAMMQAQQQILKNKAEDALQKAVDDGKPEAAPESWEDRSQASSQDGSPHSDDPPPPPEEQPVEPTPPKQLSMPTEQQGVEPMTPEEVSDFLTAAPPSASGTAAQGAPSAAPTSTPVEEVVTLQLTGEDGPESADV